MIRVSSRRRVGVRYDALAATYDRRWGTYVDRTVRATIERLSVSRRAGVLDVGCGTGALLAGLRIREPKAALAGVDISVAMLDVARRRLPGSVRILAADVQSLPFAAQSFDAVVSSSSFHYWPSPDGALRELRRVLRPGGQIVITDWCDDYLACRVCDRLLRWIDPEHRGIYGGRRCVELMETNDYQVVRFDRYRVSWLWGMMTVIGQIFAPSDRL